jgi:hypothetical protein
MMQNEKPHLILGYWPKPGQTPESIAEVIESRIIGVGNYPPHVLQYSVRDSDLAFTIQGLALHHLGFPLRKPIEEYLERGFRVAVDYFCEDWWTKDEDDRKVMDKSHKENHLQWIEPFSRSLLIGLLQEQWDDLARICAWVEADILPEYTGGDFEDELVDLYRSLAAGLRPEPMSGLEEVEARICKCRKKRPKLLFQAWDAARSGNQTAFNDAFVKAMKHFDSLFDDKSPNLRSPMFWIAQHHSIVALAARRKGMKLPELTPRQNAFLVSRESLGLSPR